MTPVDRTAEAVAQLADDSAYLAEKAQVYINAYMHACICAGTRSTRMQQTMPLHEDERSAHRVITY
jgi:hypothetical protein